MLRASIIKLCTKLPQHPFPKCYPLLFSNLYATPKSSSYLSLSNNLPIFHFSNNNTASSDRVPGESEENATLRIERGVEEEYKVLQELKKNPKNFKAHFYLGEVNRIYFRKYKEAIDSYLKAIEIKPLYWKAYGSLLALDPETTLRKLEEITKGNPHYYAEYHIGLALYSLKRYDDALESFGKSLERNPKFTAAYAWRAIVLEGQQKYDEAIKQYEEIIKLGENGDTVGLSKTPHAYHHWSIVLSQQGKYEEAIKKLLLAVEKLGDEREFDDSKEYLTKEISERSKSGKSKEEVYKSLEQVFAEVIYEGFDVQGLDYSYLTEIFPEEIKENY